MLAHKGSMARINGWNFVNDAMSIAGDVAVGMTPELIGNVTVGSAGIILYGKPGNRSVPQTRPGSDGKVSCSSCSPEDGIQNSFGLKPEEDDMYWEVNVNQVTTNGGNIDYDGGMPVTDLAGNTMGSSIYPKGHVSISFPGQSKGWVERNLLEWLSSGFNVLH